MNLLHSPLPFPSAIAGWIVLLLLAQHSLRRVRAGVPLQGAQQHVWLASAVVLAWMWTIQARAVAGAGFGLLGVAVCALIFGRDWARLALLVALALHTGLGGGSWMNFGVNGLLLATVPTLLAGLLQRQIEVRLPKNLFVFIIGNGMFISLTGDCCHQCATACGLVAAQARCGGN